jgi:acylphosphatase
MKRVTAIVYGRVQGVGFRVNAQHEANRLGVQGWVKNQWDGSVKTVAEGPDAALERYVAWLQRGPLNARVDRVEQNWSEAMGEFRGFHVRG